MQHASFSHVTRARTGWAGASEWLVALLLSANLAWTSLCLGGARAETMVASWALTSAALAVVLLRVVAGKTAGHWAPLCFLPFMLWALASARFVSPVPWLGTRDFLNWFQVIGTFAIALNGMTRKGPRLLVMSTIAALAVIALALAAYQMGGHETWLMLGRAQAPQYTGRASGFFGNPNSFAAFLVLLVPPALALAWQRGARATRRVACGYGALMLLAGLALSMSRGGMIALALALVCWPCLVREWRWPRRVAAAAAVCAAMALAAAALWAASPGLRGRFHTLAENRGEKSRLILWRASLEMTAASPLLGTGAGSFNTVFEKHRPEGFLNEPQWTHNEYLNTLSDHGAVGLALLLGAIVLVARRSARERPRVTPRLPPAALSADNALARALGAGLLAFAFACLVDFHLKIPALGMLAALCAAELTRRRGEHAQAGLAFAELADAATTREAPAGGSARDIPNSPPAQKRASRVRLVCGGALCVLLAALLCKHTTGIFRAEAARVDGREILEGNWPGRGGPGPGTREAWRAQSHSRKDLARAVALDPANAQAWSDLAYALALQARAEPRNAATLGRAAETCAREALARSRAVPEFWLRLGVALDLQGDPAGAGDAFAQALALAPASPLAWYHQAWHLALTPATRALAPGAIGMCLRLDPAYPGADALRARLLQDSQ